MSLLFTISGCFFNNFFNIFFKRSPAISSVKRSSSSILLVVINPNFLFHSATSVSDKSLLVAIICFILSVIAVDSCDNDS